MNLRDLRALCGCFPSCHPGGVARSIIQFADPDVPKGDRAVVILQADVPAPRASVAGIPLELALAHAALPIVAPQLVVDNFDAVQPMFDVRAASDDSCVVPRS